MKTLMFLFLLDFSGSMYQKVNNQIKYVILQDNVRAMNQAFNDDALQAQSAILAFGLNPKKKCDDFVYKTLPTRDLSATIDTYRPGAFSMTPLGESIGRATDISIENKVKKVVIFSDGADSCGKDPCKELIKANDKLKIANYRMSIKFIGINLKSDDPKFACFRDNKLSNIDIEYSNIGDSYDVQRALEEVTDEAGGFNPANTKSPWGLIKVKGAPSTVRFKAMPRMLGVKNDHRESWYGTYRNQLKGGDYLIKTNYPGTKTLGISIVQEQEKEIYWSDFFKDPNSQVIYKSASLSVMLVPMTQTQEAHESTKSILIEGLLKGQVRPDIRIPFGEWKIEPTSPPWLVDLGVQQTFTLRPASSKRVDFIDLLDLEWLANPNPDNEWVIEVIPAVKTAEHEGPVPQTAAVSGSTSAEANDADLLKRYYVQQGVISIPVPRGAKVNWLKSSLDQ